MFNSYTELPYRKITACISSDKIFVAYGMIAFCESTRKWFLVQRKHTPEFMFLVRGSYRPSHVKDLVNGITAKEAGLLQQFLQKEISYEELYIQTTMGSREDMLFAKRLFLDVSPTVCETLSTKKSFVNAEWLWPKGRLDSNYEKIYECAVREFQEESGIPLREAQLISKNPIVEKFKAFTGKIYETRCWVCVFPREIAPPSLGDTSIPGEIGNRGWKTREEVLSLLQGTKLQAFYEAEQMLSLYYPERRNLGVVFREHSSHLDTSP